MIQKDTIDKIFETARIEEVVGDFVTLKKRGVNLLGLCPFHNEKTPSFTVAPVKGIYKCFGCGKAGNAVNFVMDHEQLTYPDALRYLAKKYQIEIEETERTPEQVIEQNEKESLYVVSSFAQKYFTANLHTTDEGKSVGLSYFKERGFAAETIQKFQLGYSFSGWRSFTDAAIAAGHKVDYLIKTGLTISKTDTPTTPVTESALAERSQERLFDRFSGRVMFPIHNISGRVIGFGGRILTSDKKAAKYLNSPESELYHKSNVLYGLFFARKAIAATDNCFLVEGYTDVISMHQAGVENVVASSGTSLTVEQIKLIKRYTHNVTILYDGDFAGIKASFRGIDMLLEEGMNVRVLLFPDGEDPDSFSKKVGANGLKAHIDKNTKDFITFKTDLLFKDAEHDPIKRTALIKEIIESVALIPDLITRSVYIRECSRIMDMEEQTLLNELNKVRRKKASDPQPRPLPSTPEESEIALAEQDASKRPSELIPFVDASYQEKDIIRILLQFGTNPVEVDALDEFGEPLKDYVSAAFYITNDLQHDSIEFENEAFQKIVVEFNSYYKTASDKSALLESYFTNHPDKDIRLACINILSSPHSLANWEKHHITVTTEEQLLIPSIKAAVTSLKLKRVEKMIIENQKQLKATDDEQTLLLLQEQIDLSNIKKALSAHLGRIVLK